MKNIILALFAATISVLASGQNTPARIVMKSGETLDVHHFGQLDCSGNTYTKKFTLIKGKYAGIVTEISDYRDIKKITLIGFSKSPMPSVGNEKGMINILKRNGVSVTLEEAEISLSCYGGDEKYNQLEVQIKHPLNDKIVETMVQTKDIDYILFEF